jgi:hypothetical protein
MALTLAEASKLSNDILLQGVVETIVKESPILQVMPFIEIVGNGLTYNQEKTLPDIDFYDVGDNWTESTPTFEQKIANLKIMGGDADVDNFLKATRSNVQDLEAAVVELKAKALKNKFEDTFIYGDSAGNAKQFDGLRKLINTGTASQQVIATGAGGATLTLSMLDQLIDAVKGGKPDMLLMSRRSRRKINALVRASGGMMESNRDSWGNFIQYWDGVPIGVSDWVLDTHVLAGGCGNGDYRRRVFLDLCPADGRGRSLRPDRAGFCHGGTDRFAGNQRCQPQQNQMVCIIGAFQRHQSRRTYRRAG